MTPLTKNDRIVLFEVATHPGTYASAISHRIGMDGRTVSRSITRLEKDALLIRTARSQNNGTRNLTLTSTGRATALLLFATTMTEAAHAAD